MIKKLAAMICVTLFLTVGVGSAHAEMGRRGPGEIKGAMQDLRDARKDVRTSVKNLTEDLKQKFGSGPGIFRDFLKRGRAAIGSGVVTSKNGSTLMVEKDGKTYAILTDSKTQFRRRFWGKSSFDEISVNDVVNVIGKWTDDAKTTIRASLVRDVSIQKRFGVFFGQVKIISPTGWVMSTIGGNRPDQTVTVSPTTKFTDVSGHAIVQSDIVIGHRVRVKGLWDNINNTVSEVREVKDFSLPPAGSATPAITGTITPTPTALVTVTLTPTATLTPTVTVTPTVTPTP
jgi:hypothetical protein